MKNTEIKKIFKGLYVARPEFLGCQINLIKSGHNRSIYSVITTDNKKYIAKIGNIKKDLGSTNLNDVRVQTFLSKMGCDFIPGIIYADRTNDFYIESYVGEQDIAFNDLTNEDIDTFAKQLVFIHNLSPDQYKAFSIDHGFNEPKITSLTDGLNTFGFARFEIVKELCPDNTVKDWIQEHLQQSVAILQKDTNSNQTAHLRWGDIGENLRIDDHTLYFIDWEFAGLGYGSELAYIKIHSHLDSEKFDLLVSRYAFYSDKAESELLDEVRLTEKITRTNDVVWAAMKWGESVTSDDIEKYKTLTYKRIELANNL
jgi:hypothetical protein